ncbi:MAG: hypothetical protein WCA97_19585 [Terriglobales bacterium]
MSAQFWNAGFKPDLGIQAGDFAPQPACRKRCFNRSVARNIADFCFHAAAAPARTALQSSLDGVLDIPDDQLGHGIPTQHS